MTARMTRASEAAGQDLTSGSLHRAIWYLAPAMTINLLTPWAMEVPVAFGLSRWLGLAVTGVWWGRAVANVANGLFFALWFHRGRWKKLKV